jgi:hypothetical protein
MSEADAIQLIRKSMPMSFQLSPTTEWAPGEISVSDLYEKIFGADSNQFRTTTFVELDNAEDGIKVPEGSWYFFDDGRTSGIRISDNNEILRLARLSMDRGWPTTFHTSDHAMTFLGYQETAPGMFYYAVSDTSGAYFGTGVSWQSTDEISSVLLGITVYYDTLKDQLPAPPALLTRSKMPIYHTQLRH